MDHLLYYGRLHRTWKRNCFIRIICHTFIITIHRSTITTTRQVKMSRHFIRFIIYIRIFIRSSNSKFIRLVSQIFQVNNLTFWINLLFIFISFEKSQKKVDDFLFVLTSRQRHRKSHQFHNEELIITFVAIQSAPTFPAFFFIIFPLRWKYERYEFSLQVSVSISYYVPRNNQSRFST